MTHQLTDIEYANEGKRLMLYLVRRSTSEKVETIYPRHWFDWIHEKEDNHYGIKTYVGNGEVSIRQDHWDLYWMISHAMRTYGDPDSWGSYDNKPDAGMCASAETVKVKGMEAFGRLYAEMMRPWDIKADKREAEGQDEEQQ